MSFLNKKPTRIPRNTWHPTFLPSWMPEHPDLPSLDDDEYMDDFGMGGPLDQVAKPSEGK